MPETILNTSHVLTQQTFVVAIIAFILLVKALDSESAITWLTSTYVAEPGFESRLSDFWASNLNYHTIFILCQKSDPCLRPCHSE